VPDWLLWLILAALLAIGEVLTLGFLLGELWSARAFMEGEIMEPGARVEVAKIEGATALVYQ
jgi:membrane protein implicated in regulation of membrane protease activity